MSGESQNLALNPGEVVTVWKEFKNEPAFYIGVRRPEYPENPVSYSIITNWRIRLVRGVAVAIDETDSDTYSDLQLITAEPGIGGVQMHSFSQRTGRINAGQRAALPMTDEDKRQGRDGIPLTDQERRDLEKRGGVAPLTPEERAQEKVEHGIPPVRQGGNAGQAVHKAEGADTDPTPSQTAQPVPPAQRNPPLTVHGSGDQPNRPLTEAEKRERGGLDKPLHMSPPHEPPHKK